MLAGAVGAIARSRGRAFLAGVATHLLADLVPHRDFSLPVEAAMAAAALMAVGRAAGFDSPAFAGAVGGVAPDVENALAALGVIERPCFPSHRGAHGRPVREVASQVALSCAAFEVILWQARRDRRARAASD
jgi:hypothetical protein